MVTPTAPITSTSSAKLKKPKKPTTKPPKEPAKSKIADAASSTDDDETYSELIASAHEESPDPPLAYVPPAGSVPADFDVDVDFGEFDYDAVKAEEGAELWLVRAPNEVRAKNLQGIHVLSSPSSIVGRVGELSRKSTAYDIWSLSAPSSSSSASTGDSHHTHVCAEELNGLSVLLPRKRKDGKLFLAPKPVTRHLVVTARPAEPTQSSSGDATLQNPPREAYPDEVLTHRFRPYGAPRVFPPPVPPEDQMDDRDEHVEAAVKEKEKERRKKRRGETGESPKKVKKVKTAASS